MIRGIFFLCLLLVVPVRAAVELTVAGMPAIDYRSINGKSDQFGIGGRIYGSIAKSISRLRIGGMATVDFGGSRIVYLAGPFLRYGKKTFIEGGGGFALGGEGNPGWGIYGMGGFRVLGFGLIGFSVFYVPPAREELLYGPVFGLVF